MPYVALGSRRHAAIAWPAAAGSRWDAIVWPAGPTRARRRSSAATARHRGRRSPTRLERGRLPRLSLPPQVPGRQARPRACRPWPASRSRCRSPCSSRHCCSSATSWPQAAPAKRPSTSMPRSSRRQHRRRSLLDGVADARSGRDPHRRGPPRPRARSGLAGRRARRQPVRATRCSEMLFGPVAHHDSALRRRARRLDARLLPGVRLVAGAWPKSSTATACCAARSAPLAWELTTLRVHLLRRSRRAVRHRGARRGANDRRVEVCGTCSGYLKTVDVAELSPFPLLAIADLETMDLDMAAMEQRLSAARAQGTSAQRRPPFEPRPLESLTRRSLRGAARTPARCPCAGCCRARPS